MTVVKHCKIFQRDLSTTSEGTHRESYHHSVQVTCASHTCLHIDFLPFLRRPHLPHSGDQESYVCPERRPSPHPGPAPCSVDLGWGTCSGAHTTPSVQQQEAECPWGLGDNWAVPTCFLPLDRAQINHGAGLDRELLPASNQPWVPTATAPQGSPRPFSSTCRDGHPELPQASIKPQEPPWEGPTSAGLHSPTGAGSSIQRPAMTLPENPCQEIAKVQLTISSSMSKSLQAPYTGGLAGIRREKEAVVSARPRNSLHGTQSYRVGPGRWGAYSHRVSSVPWACGWGCRTPRQKRHDRYRPTVGEA